jgi:hypothetical protein
LKSKKEKKGGAWSTKIKRSPSFEEEVDEDNELGMGHGGDDVRIGK